MSLTTTVGVAVGAASEDEDEDDDEEEEVEALDGDEDDESSSSEPQAATIPMSPIAIRDTNKSRVIIDRIAFLLRIYINRSLHLTPM